MTEWHGHRRLVVFALTLLSLAARGESPASLPLLLAPHAIGVVSGRRDSIPPDPKSGRREIELRPFVVRLDFISKDTGRPSHCTGTVIEGCILFSAHCDKAADSPPYVVSVGVDGRGGQFLGGASTTLGDGETPGGDLRVMKMVTPLPEFRSLPKSALATDRLKAGTVSTIVGYGFRETQELADGQRISHGVGTRRYGLTSVKGYFAYGGEVGKVKYDKEGDLLVVERNAEAPNISAPGDSGGPLIHDKKIYGVSSQVMPTRLGATFKEKGPDGKERILSQDPVEDNQIHADEIMRAIYTSVPDNHEWITKTLAKHGCDNDTQEALIAKVAKSASEKIAAATFEKDWGKLSDDDRNAIVSDVRRLAGVPDGAEITVEPVAFRGSLLHLSISVGKPGTPDHRTMVGHLGVGTPPSWRILR